MRARQNVFLALIVWVTVSYADSTIVAGNRDVKEFGGSKVIYNYDDNQSSKTYALISINNNYWLYRQNDTLRADSTTLLLSKIDTVSKSVTYIILSSLSNPNKSKSRVGMMEKECFNAPLWTLRLDSVQSNAAKMTLFVLPASKHYVTGADTVVLSRDTLTLFHVFEGRIPVANCRDMFVAQAIPMYDHIGFYGWSQCQGLNYAHFFGRLFGSSLGLNLYFENDSETTKSLFLAEPYDSITRIISVGETCPLPAADLTISLEWIASGTYFSFAGFTVTSGITVVRSAPMRHASYQPYSVSATINLLGRQLPRQAHKGFSGRIIKHSHRGENLILK
jgi:hypothetical protein